MKMTVLAFLITLSGLAAAQTDYRLPTAEARTGTRIRANAAKDAKFPLDKKYEEFTAQERAAFKSAYEEMPEDDEPPFPRDGLKKFILDVRDATTKRQARGLLVLVALVDRNGTVEKVDIYESPDVQLARYAAIMLGRIPFKPAKCSGQPCSMEFPFRARLLIE